jgi:Zinc finger, C3HC4 type (RING finger)
MSNKTTIYACVPCGHTLCSDCAERVDATCFECRTPSTSLMKVFARPAEKPVCSNNDEFEVMTTAAIGIRVNPEIRVQVNQVLAEDRADRGMDDSSIRYVRHVLLIVTGLVAIAAILSVVMTIMHMSK